MEITGAAPGDFSGHSLAAGDFNGDGHVDLAILSYGAAPLGGSRRGIVDLIWGPLAGGTLLDLANAPGTRIFGTLNELDILSSLSTGDLNADGFDDLIWGQPFDRLIDGKVTVVLGRPVFPDTMDLATGPQGTIIVRGRDLGGASLGRSMCACDIDGDGFDDLILGGAREYTHTEIPVVHGSDSLRSLYDMAQSYADVSIMIEVAEFVDGAAELACADFDRDGREDLVLADESYMGDPVDDSDDRPGLVRILFGHTSWRDTVYVTDPAFRTITLLPPNPWAFYTMKVATAGPEGEIFVADSNANPLGCSACGEVYRTFPVVGLPDSLSINSVSVTRTVLVGDGPYDTIYGWNLTTGDFDDDNRTDVVVASRDDLDQNVIVFGVAAAQDTVFMGTDTSSTRILAREPGQFLGRGMAVADFDGDGVDDVALASDFAVTNRGQTYVIFGNSTPTPVLVSSFVARNGPAGVSLTWSVSSLAEVRGWHLDRSEEGRYVRLTGAPLDPTARSFDDASAQFDVTYTYQLIALTDQGEEVAGIATASRAAPALVLYQNVPNPFNPMTTIRFSLPREGRAVLTVYGVDGARIVRLVDEKRPAGLNEVRWDGRDAAGHALASGVYFYRLEAGGRVLTRKLVLVR